jgi:hypothetical protein
MGPVLDGGGGGGGSAFCAPTCVAPDMTKSQAPSPTHTTEPMANRAADFIERPQINPLLTGTG